MAVGEIPVTVVGTIVSEPDFQRIGEKRSELVTFLLRSTERRFDKIKGEWADGRQFAVRVKCWRRLALGVRSCLHKGDPVIVSGRIYSPSAGGEGELRALPEIEATAIGPSVALCAVSIQRGHRPELAGRGSVGATVPADVSAEPRSSPTVVATGG